MHGLLLALFSSCRVHNVPYSTSQLPCKVPPVHQKPQRHSHNGRGTRSNSGLSLFPKKSMKYNSLVGGRPMDINSTDGPTLKRASHFAGLAFLQDSAGVVPANTWFLDNTLPFWTQMRHVTQQRWHLLWFATCSVTAFAVGLKADQQSPLILCWKILQNDERGKAEDAVDKDLTNTSYVHGSKLVIYSVTVRRN